MFYNPANMIMAKFLELDFDVSMAQFRYQYQHTDSERFPDPAVIQSSQPMLTLSAAFRPFESFVLGFAALPTGTGVKQEIRNVPIELLPEANPGVYDRYTLINQDTSYKMAFGFAYRPDFAFSIGAGIIRTQERFSHRIFGPDQTEAEIPYIDALYGGAAYQTIIGLRSEVFERSLVLALSYKTAVVKKYGGDVLYDLEGVDEYQPFAGADYDPAAIAFGIETRIESIGFFGEVVSEQWSAGRNLMRRGIIPGEPLARDLKNTLNFAGGIKYWAAPLHMLQISYGNYPGNTGDGIKVDLPILDPESDSNSSASDNGAELTQALQDNQSGRSTANDSAGVSFGDFEAIPRTVFGAGYRYKIEDRGYIQLGAHHQAGTRRVAEGFDGEGSYQLSMTSVSLGVAFGL